MKTCVLFPHAFPCEVLSSSTVSTVYNTSSSELFINPVRENQSLRNLDGVKRKLRRKLTFFNTDQRNAGQSKSKKMQILHVEDNPQIRLITSIFLKRESDITSIENGEKALEIAAARHFDLVLMDVNLGDGIDGFETTRRIRQMNGYINIPIIALTANDYNDVRSECLSSGINAYIQKPFEKSHLIGTIREINQHLAKSLS